MQSPKPSLFAYLAMILIAAAAGCAGELGGKEGGTAKVGDAPGGTAKVPPGEVSRQVIIDNFTFDPPQLTIAVGAKVTWINRDDVPHTATSTVKPRAFDSGALDTDQQFTFAFTKPGTYDYFCAAHPKMTGQIVVK